MQIPAFVREGNVPAQAAHFLEERTILRKKLRLDDRSINLTHYQWLFKEGCDAVQTSSGWCRKCKIHMQKEESWISICASRLVAWCYSSFTRRLLPAPRTTTCFAILRGWRDSTQNMTTWYCITGRKRYTVVVPLCGKHTHWYISISNRPKTSKNMHMQGWIQRDMTTDKKEEKSNAERKRSSLCSLPEIWSSFLWKSFCPTRSMDFLHEVHFKNSCQKFSSAHLLVYVMRYFTCIYYRYNREMLAFLQFLFLYFWVFF